MKAEALYEIAEEMWGLYERTEHLCPASPLAEEISCCALKVEAEAATAAATDEGGTEQDGVGEGFTVFEAEEFYDPETGETYVMESVDEQGDGEAA